jgi:hypothetical protein
MGSRGAAAALPRDHVDCVKPDWFLDWSSAGAAIVAPGPSAKSADVAKLKGKVPVFAVKQGVDLCPWADAVYGCDAAWWRFRRGLPTFSGLKLRWSGNGCCDFSDVVGVTIRDNALDRIIVDEPGVIGSGRNSGFQALNIAVQFGARRILLIGFDMHGQHFYGRNNWAMCSNPDEWNFSKWRRAFAAGAADLKALGVEVVNLSMPSTLSCFRKASVDQVISEWNL